MLHSLEGRECADVVVAAEGDVGSGLEEAPQGDLVPGAGAADQATEVKEELAAVEGPLPSNLE